MSQKQTITPAPSALKLADVYFILFRHKWMILGLTALSLIASSVTFSYWQMPYRSVAEIYISSVSTPHAPGETTGDNQRLDLSPAVVLNTEVLILKSLNLASNAADLVGPEKILGRDGASTNVSDAARAAVRDEAALAIQRNLEAGAIRESSVIELVYTHPNRAVVTDVLEKLIGAYEKEHSELHEHLHMYDTMLADATDTRKHRLKDIEDQLATLKSDGEVVDVEKAKEVFATTEETIRQGEIQSKSDLALWKATAEELLKQIPAANQTETATTNATKATNATVAAPSRSLIAQYTKISQKVQELQAEAEQLERRGLGSAAPSVLTNQFELAAAQEEKSKLEDANQGLLNVATSVSMPGQGSTANGPNPAADLKKVQVTIVGLTAKIQSDEEELARLKARGANLNKLGDGIKDLERDEAMVEREYQEIYAAKAKADLEEKVKDVGNINIKVIQSPSTPVRDVKTVSRVILGIGASGPVLALLLAIVWELVLYRSFKRPQEVITRLKLPFFLSIPNLKAKDMKRQQEFNLPKEAKMLPASAGDTPAAGAENKALVPSKSGDMATWDEKHLLRPFHETLRDRLVSYFEMINLTHKPKLVAVTSCGGGAGVSTVASGLASSLSETGDGNVLLVDMNSENGEAHHFFKGQLAMGLDDILEKQKDNRANALVSDNLYVVKESSNGDKLPSILPKRFSHLVTKLKASDYDYIILDMPPVTEISVTPRLAKFMDMVLLVVEAGKTNQDVAQRAATLLTESRANVGVVMNKCRTYVPRRLLHEA